MVHPDVVERGVQQCLGYHPERMERRGSEDISRAGMRSGDTDILSGFPEYLLSPDRFGSDK